MKLRNISLLIICLTISYISKSQTPLKHQQKYYERASDGRFFSNMHLPCYLWFSVSASPDAPKQRLKSEVSKRYSNPFYLDTEGYNSIHTPVEVDTVTKKIVEPKRNVIFEIYADGLAPITHLSFSNSILYKKGEQLYCGKNTTITLTAKDNSSKVKKYDETSGVENIYQSIDKQEFTTYSKTISFDKEKQYDFAYYSVDNVGNVEKMRTENFTVDLTASQSTFQIVGIRHEDILAPSTEIKITATDNASGVRKIYYKIDEGREIPYTSPIKMFSIPEGEHTLTYFSVDNVSNREEKKTYSFYVDKTAPMVIEETVGDQFLINGKEYSSGRTKLKLTAVDNKAGVKELQYSVAGGAYQKYTDPFYLPKKSGVQAIKYFAIDNVENKNNNFELNNKKKGNSSTYMDLTGPALKYEYKGPALYVKDTIYINKHTKIRLIANDTESGLNKVTYNIDKQSDTTYISPFNAEKDGRHKVTFTGYDNVNNTNSREFSFVVDNEGPEIFPRFSILPIGNITLDGKKLDIYPKSVALYLSATDAVVGTDKIYYKINKEIEKVYGMYISNFKAKTRYHIKLRSTDKLGNPSTKEIDFMTE